MAKKEILMLISSFQPLVGGAEKQAERLAINMARKYNYRYTVLTRWHPGLSFEEDYMGMRIIRLKVGNIGKIAPLIYMIKSLNYMRKNSSKIEVVHAHALSAPGLTAAFASKYLKIPSVAKIAGGGNKEGCEIIQIPKKNMGSFKLNFLKKNITKFIAISKSIEQDLIKSGVEYDKISFIPNGLNFMEYNPANKEKNDIINFIYVGRRQYVKGFDVLNEAWNLLPQEYMKSAKLTVLGDGPIEPTFNTPVELFGNVTNVSDYLKKANVFLLPSRYEGISNSLLEAVASNLYIIATSVGGNLDVLDEKYCTIIPPEDINALTDAIKETIDYFKYESHTISKELNNQLNFTKSIFDFENIILEYKHLYDSVGGKNEDGVSIKS